MSENYFSTLSKLTDINHRYEEVNDELTNLRYGDKFARWCKDDPELDRLRQEAENAMAAYATKLCRIGHAEVDRLYDKLDNSDKVIIWDNLFKKRRHP